MQYRTLTAKGKKAVGMVCLHNLSTSLYIFFFFPSTKRPEKLQLQLYRILAEYVILGALQKIKDDLRGDKDWQKLWHLVRCN